MNEFKDVVDNFTNAYDIFEHVRCHNDEKYDEIIACKNSDDIYGAILKVIIDNDFTKFHENKYPWKYVACRWHRSTLFELNLDADDLSENRMKDLDSDYEIEFYFTLGVTFLKNNKIENLPMYYVDFFKNYRLRLNRLLSLIESEIVRVDYDFDLPSELMKPKCEGNFNLEIIKMLILFIQTYSYLLQNKSISNNGYPGVYQDHPKKEHLIEMITNLFFDSLTMNEIDDSDEKPIYYYNGTKLDSDNAMSVFFDLENFEFIFYHEHNSYTDLSDFFELMRLDEQVIFWNILVKRQLIESTVIESQSEVFIDHFFENLKLGNKEKLDDELFFNDNNFENVSGYFLQKYISIYPDMKDVLILHLMFKDFDNCMHLFPELSENPHVMVDILIRKFL
jgi:hypothetical protein